MAAAVIEMVLLGRFLKKYVPYQTTGLFLSYPVLIFVYMVSGLRQAMAICIFLGLVLSFYLEKKWIQYVIGVLIAASFHKVGYGWLVLVIAYYIPVWGMVTLTGAAMVVGLIIQIPVVEQLILGILPCLSYDAVSHRGQHEPVCCGRACGKLCSIVDAIYMALQAKGRDSQVGTAVVQSIYLWCLLLYVDVRECLLCQPLCDNLQGCGVCGGRQDLWHVVGVLKI